MIKRLCTHAGCSRFRLEGHTVCEKHLGDEEIREQRKKEYFAKKYQHTFDPIRSKYTNSARWKAIRKQWLSEHPYCEKCGQLADQVHHAYPQGWDYFNDEDFYSTEHLVSLCSVCHSKETARLGGHSK